MKRKIINIIIIILLITIIDITNTKTVYAYKENIDTINNIKIAIVENDVEVDSTTQNNKMNIDTSTIDEQKELFGISDFVKESQKYSGDFFKDIDLTDTLSQAISGKIDNNTIYKKILSLFGTEVRSSITTLISILIIIVIHSILKSISDSLEDDSISKIIYYVQYILIVTIIMSNFGQVIELVKETARNLVGFMNSLIPILIVLMTYTGTAITSSLVQPVLLFMINFIGNIIQNILIPVVLVVTVLAIISKISERTQIVKITKFMKSSVTWFLGIMLTLFVGILSLEGTLTSSVDGITAKTTKAAVSSLIPVVGKILGDTVDSVLGCGVILKNAVGVVGVIVIIGICVVPIIKLGTLSIIYNLASGIIEPIADEKIVKLLEEMGGIFKLLFGIICALSVMLIIGITLVVKISNSGMMYR
ncbi:MAG: stage III sporulation protein AE [Clostridia bacterium]|nr:stage III sporulation protein AE [Clostridia bacterium]